MTTKKSIGSDNYFEDCVKSFYVDPDSIDLNLLQRDGASAIINLANDFAKFGVNGDTDLIAHALGRLSDIQVRDFALGCHNAETLETHFEMWEHLLAIAPCGFIAPVACLLASLAYERGDISLANKSLDRAAQDDPEYSLTMLLRRVFSSNWPPAAFAAMRADLHPKVSAAIFG